MSVHVLLNILNELGKRDKMRGSQSILSLFRDNFNKFNNTGARMLDSSYHMILKYFFFVKTYRFAIDMQHCYWHYFITLHVPENL